MNDKLSCWILVLSLLGAAHCVAAENWPAWRGAASDGVATAGEYPQRFSSDENVVWKVPLPGRGCSTPVVWGNQIFVTCGINGHDGVVCYDFLGEELWRQQFGVERSGRNRAGSGSNPSPVTDGEHLVVYYKSGTVAGLTLDGSINWQGNLQEKYGEDKMWWDLGTSPVLAAGNAVIHVMNAGPCYIVALDLETGDVAWKQDRTYDTAVESDQGYTTPSVYRHGDQEVIVAAGSDHVTGHDARTGELLWECSGLNPSKNRAWRMIASPVLADDMVIVPYGRGGWLAAVRLEGSGDVTDSHIVWNKSMDSPEVPTPVVAGGKIILLSMRGHVSCHDVTNGEQLWWADLPRNRNRYFASPVLAGNTLYCAREDGMVFTCEINVGLTVVAENDLGEQLIASPVPIRGQLLVRGSENLYLFQ